MGLLDRTRTLRFHPEPRSSVTLTSGLTGAQLLEAADVTYALAEQDFDRSPRVRGHAQRRPPRRR